MNPNLKFLPVINRALLLNIAALAQEAAPKKGSYLYFGQPNIEDKSMFIEEPFNQGRKIIQHISNLIFDDAESTYYYTIEIPVADYWHHFNLMADYTFTSDIERGVTTNTSMINPGFRFAFSANNIQIVPCLGLPSDGAAVAGNNQDFSYTCQLSRITIRTKDGHSQEFYGNSSLKSTKNE